MFREIGKAVRDARTRRDYYDYNLLAAIILLVAFGLIILYSASSYDAASNAKMANDSMWYLKHQAPISAIAVVLCVFISRYDYHYLKSWAGILYVISLGLMMMVRLTPLGVSANGSRRWLKLGIQFQPAEIAKIAVIIFIPYLAIKLGRKINTLKGTLFLLFWGAVPAAFAWYFTDNLSTGLIIGAITMVIIFVSHPRTKPFMILLAVVAVVAVIIVIYASTLEYDPTGNFRLRRVQVWLHPEQYSAFGGYQVIQGLYAIGSGGLFGKGLGNSAQKISSIPEAQNDMIFAIICEELGLFGAVSIILIFLFMIFRFMVIANNAPDLFGALLTVGVMAHIAIQVVLNIAVVTNTIPNTGITLPFISYGGTSVLFTMIEMGIVLSVSNRIRLEN